MQNDRFPVGTPYNDKLKTDKGNDKIAVDTSSNGLYREAPPERGTFFRPQVYERLEISVSKKAQKG